MRARLLAAVLALAAGWAQAGAFDTLPAPKALGMVAPSSATTHQDYRLDAARSVYERLPDCIIQGKVKAWVHAIVITDVEVDAEGRITSVRVVREPASAKEVVPWLVSLISSLSRLPAPQAMGGATWRDVWLIDENGHFQLDTLTEGQEEPEE